MATFFNDAASAAEASANDQVHISLYFDKSNPAFPSIYYQTVDQNGTFLAKSYTPTALTTMMIASALKIKSSP
jgi:hypothetical protein